MGAEPDPAAMKLDGKSLQRRARRAVRLNALAVRGDSSTYDVVLHDLHYEGCGIATPIELTPGEEITLSVLCRGGIKASVRWYKDGRAGLVFAPEEMGERSHSPRVSERISLSADVSLRRLGQLSFRVAVSDLSPEGCKVDLVERPAIGEHMLIKFEGLEVLDSVVCWIDGYVAGLRFERAIHPAVFDLLLERLTS